jgi:hypothetical protein
MDFSLCSSALGDGPGKITSPSTFAQAEKLVFDRRHLVPSGFQRMVIASKWRSIFALL